MRQLSNEEIRNIQLEILNVYEFHCPEIDPDYPRPWGRLVDNNTVVIWKNMKYMNYGIHIDIVLYDNAPDDDRTVKKMFLARDVMMKLNSARWHGIFEPAEGNILRKICVHIARTAVRVFPRNYFTQKLIRNSI